MLVPLENVTGKPPNHRLERTLWHDADRNVLSLGCSVCPDRSICGGLQVRSPVFDCLDLCCLDPEHCDSVCRRKPEEFARRVREIGGFSLDNVPRAPVLQAPKLPKLVPTLFHGNRRRAQFREWETVCLPLYKVIHRHDGQIRYESTGDLAEGFRISPNMMVILTGTAIDPPLERWWPLGSKRREVIRSLRKLGIALVTTPNYSLFVDQPRWDDLHGMKRIALVHEEFLSEGLPAALHLNARTDRDWERWRDYIAGRPEVTHVTFEFATGAGRAGLVRGGASVLPKLIPGFPAITVLETSAFVKTVKRQRAELTDRCTLNWVPSPTANGQALDDLLTENWKAVAASYARLPGRWAPPLLEAAG